MQGAFSRSTSRGLQNNSKQQRWTMDTVLIVDDDQKLLKMLRRTLVYEGFDVATAADGREALQMIYAQQPNVIVLDWMMPELDGLGVLKALRSDQNETPILMLTARDAIEDRVEGLEGGADDYLIKPFAPAELVARVNALLRRTSTNVQESFSFADLTLDPLSREGRRGTRGFALSPTEFALLRLLMRHPRQVLARSQILANIWGLDFPGDDNIIEVYVGYLRKKMEEGGEPRLIQTIRGVGYVLREEE
jgi:two-component system response regulator MprA